MYIYYGEYFVGLYNFSLFVKFDFGIGWLLFYFVIEVIFSDVIIFQFSVVEKYDYSYGMVRVEVFC